ncbi:MAG: DUF2971 domain-containing protein [Bacteroidales bacterium]|nr:DUF2971 domain-containing protein [Bacteroidales bacterium]
MNDLYSGLIYKYIDIEGGKESLKNKTIQISKPTATNDPFECHSAMVEMGNIEKYANFLMDSLHSDWSIAKRRKARSVYVHNYKKYGIKHVIEKERTRLAFASFSKSCTVIPLWAYYSNNHTGICLCYEVDKHVNLEGQDYFAMVVNYQEEMEKLFISEKDIDFYKKWLTRKSIEWQHEREVRLVNLKHFTDLEKQRLIYPKNSLKKIIFGLNTLQEDVEEVIEIVNKYYPEESIRFSEVELNNKMFLLDEIDITT